MLEGGVFHKAEYRASTTSALKQEPDRLSGSVSSTLLRAIRRSFRNLLMVKVFCKKRVLQALALSAMGSGRKKGCHFHPFASFNIQRTRSLSSFSACH